jgi:hypothetical protein
MVRSKEPGVRTLAVVVMPRNRRSKNGMLHSGSSAQARTVYSGHTQLAACSGACTL